MKVLRTIRSFLDVHLTVVAAALSFPCASCDPKESGPPPARVQSADNLRQLAVSMHNYANDKGRLPASAIYSKNGQPLLSWRVAILPYVRLYPDGRSEEALFRQFKLDEPWDSPHNKRLLAKMPQVFQSPGTKPKNPNSTFYQAIVGSGTVFSNSKGTVFGEIADGVSMTFLLVEANEAVPWTKPEDVTFSGARLAAKTGGVFEDGFHAALVDGCVYFIKKPVDEVVLRAGATISGGEPFSKDVFEYMKAPGERRKRKK